MLKTSENGDTKPNIEINGEAINVPLAKTITEQAKGPQVTPPVPNLEPEPMIKLSQVDEMINNRLSELKKELTKKSGGDFNAKDLTQVLSEALSRDRGQNGSTALVKEEDIDINDVLAEDVIFWSYGHTFGINSEKRNGHNVIPPYGRAIHFTHSWTDIRGMGKNKTVFKVNTFKTSSKKVADWLRKSPLYKTRIFENIKSVANIDMYFAQKLTDAANTISGLEPPQVLQRAQNAGLEITSDYDSIRNQLIQKIAMEEYEKSKQISLDAAAPTDLSPDKIIKRTVSKSTTPAPIY